MQDAKQPGLAPKRLISTANISLIPTFDLNVKNPDGGEEVIHRSPEDIMDEIAALDAESADVLANIKVLLNSGNTIMSKKIEVLSREVRLTGVNDQDYICLTDIARYKDSERTDYLISNWLRNRNTIEFLGIWEQINNPGFNPIEFDGIKKDAGLNSFILTAKQWTERTGAIGTRHSRAGGNPVATHIPLDPRLRGDDGTDVESAEVLQTSRGLL